MKKLLLMLLSVWGVLATQAQETTVTSGSEASGSGGSSSYTVGQVFYQNHTESGSVAQGVQQPYEISVITGIEDAKSISLTLKAYPNPTTDYLTLEVKDFDISKLSFHLCDIKGKLLQSNKITERLTEISMGSYVSGNYFVKIILENKELKTFKIVKN